MRWGYSNLLSETIDATAIEYDDCRAFQIVCPNCREPIFKGVRDQPATTHYLSHYPAAQAYAAECELRVGSFDTRSVEERNIISRGQKLQIYLGVLRAAIERHVLGGGMQESMTFLARSKALAAIRDFRFDKGAFLPRDAFDQTTRRYVDSWLPKLDPIFRSRFSVQTHVGIAWDMFQTLFTRPARQNFDHLFNAAYTVALYLLQREDYKNEELLHVMAWIPARNKRNGIELWEDAKRMADPVSTRGGTLHSAMMSILDIEMCGALVRLPYYEMLVEARS